MFEKIGFSDYNGLTRVDDSKVLADQRIMRRFDKLASAIKNIAPKSDDFLYFSIIFLKSAEASLIDDDGETKVLAGGEKAWGYFDKDWLWHGNTKPHRNNNGDIFPESELKKATSAWIGMPLCKDHQSSSVDGIRGIILDTHYDEKRKQVVGLCALDKINYPDLARKVETGMVRYGSMGTAVETSVCTECGNFAQTQDEYCTHVTGRSGYGEINIGLSPIEYSLVVQPAEPAARLLRCIASLSDYRQEFSNYGVQNVDNMLGSLNEAQASELSGIMTQACSDDGCSVVERRNIVTSFLNNLVDIKKRATNDLGELVAAIKLLSDPNVNEDDKRILRSKVETDYRSLSGDGELGQTSTVKDHGSDLQGAPLGESITDPNFVGGGGFSPDSSNTGSGSWDSSQGALVSSYSGDSFDREGNIWDADGAIQEGGLPLAGAEVKNNNNITIKSILEDIMNESRLRKRAELRRRIAYHQGGADGVEPNTYKSESYDGNKDKHMQQTGNLGGDKGMAPGDAETKQKLSRAAYNGPALRTKFAQKRMLDGSINKAASVFSVYAGNDMVLKATAGEIFGPELEENWGWVTSRDYGKEVVKQIRESGVQTVSALLKESQELAEPAEDAGPPMEELPPLPELPELPEMDGDLAEEPMGDEDLAEEPADEDGPSAPKRAEMALVSLEDGIAEVRDIIREMSGEGSNNTIKIDINDGDANAELEGEGAEQIALASNILNQLKASYSEMSGSADELAMIVETYQGKENLTASQIRDLGKISNAAIRDSNVLRGESSAICKMARTMSESLVKTSEYAEDVPAEVESGTNAAFFAEPEADNSSDELISEAMELRKRRRSAIVNKVAKRALSERKSKRELIAKRAMEANIAPETVTTETVKDAVSVEEAQTNASVIKDMLNETVANKREEEGRDSYRLKLRRAYDLGMEMQRKGLVAQSKTALDKQVDDIMLFDDRAFEAFKRSVGNTRGVSSVKIAADLGGVNIGVEAPSVDPQTNLEVLASMWD